MTGPIRSFHNLSGACSGPMLSRQAHYRDLCFDQSGVGSRRFSLNKEKGSDARTSPPSQQCYLHGTSSLFPSALRILRALQA